MSRHRVAVTGLGAVSPAGICAGDFFDRLLAGESFIGLHTIDEPPRPITQPAVHCAGFDGDALLGRPIASATDRSVQMALASCFEAWQAAGFERAKKVIRPSSGWPGAQPWAAAAPLSAATKKCGKTAVSGYRPCRW